MEAIEKEFAAFTRGTEKSRDVHFHVPSNEDSQTVCEARLAHHGVTLANADAEAPTGRTTFALSFTQSPTTCMRGAHSASGGNASERRSRGSRRTSARRT